MKEVDGLCGNMRERKKKREQVLMKGLMKVMEAITELGVKRSGMDAEEKNKQADEGSRRFACGYEYKEGRKRCINKGCRYRYEVGYQKSRM